MFEICITEDKQVIGHLSVESFRHSVRASSREILADTVANFNALRESQGETTRVQIVFK
jgi:hypothetical protein